MGISAEMPSEAAVFDLCNADYEIYFKNPQDANVEVVRTCYVIDGFELPMAVVAARCGVKGFLLKKGYFIALAKTANDAGEACFEVRRMIDLASSDSCFKVPFRLVEKAALSAIGVQERTS